MCLYVRACVCARTCVRLLETFEGFIPSLSSVCLSVCLYSIITQHLVQVMQIIPETMFTVLHQIIEIQTHRIKEVTTSQLS